MLRSTNSIAFFDASRRPRGLITTWTLESSEPKSLKSVCSSAALANSEQIVVCVVGLHYASRQGLSAGIIFTPNSVSLEPAAAHLGCADIGALFHQFDLAPAARIVPLAGQAGSRGAL